MKKTQSKRQLLSVPTQPFDPVGATTPAEVLERMQQTAFQGKNLGIAFDVWKKMLADDCTIMMGMSGAMVPTGANFFHDLHETKGNYHYQGSHKMDDVVLGENLVDRMYDVLADEEKFR